MKRGTVGGTPAFSRRSALPDERGEPVAAGLFRALDLLEREADSTAHDGQSRWMIPYADLLTLLLGLFLTIAVLPGPLHKESQPTNQVPIRVSRASSSQNLSSDSKPVGARLEKRLREAMRLPGMSIRQQDQGIVLSLKESVLFKPGEAELSAAAHRTLDMLADRLVGILGASSGPIRIEGHTDDTPIATSRYPSNWELSTARATNIVRYLVESRHFPPDRLSAAGYGEFRPLEDNSSIEGKRKNRRVDIVILNSGMAREEPHGQTH